MTSSHNISLPAYEKLPVHLLSSCFRNTSASYKFYWLLSIIELISEKDSKILSLREILIRMVCNAWYPVHYFKLSFGLQDKLSDNIKEIQRRTQIPVDEDKNKLHRKLSGNNEESIERLILHFGNLVPYHFLSPWITGSKREVINYSMSNRGSLYKIDPANKNIIISDEWFEYIKNNLRIILDFCYWNLCRYLQNKNQNVPNIPGKIIRPVKRESLSKQKKYWEIIIRVSNNLKCIYSGEQLKQSNLHIEHFIPWSFVAHNLMWNLVPVIPTANSQKSNYLPAIEKYLYDFVSIQKIGIKIIYEMNPSDKILEDYLLLGSLEDIIHMPDKKLFQQYSAVINPLIQTALNMGYKYWSNR